VPDAAFPWGEAMAFGLGHLKLAAPDFWAIDAEGTRAAADGYFGPRSLPPDRAMIG